MPRASLPRLHERPAASPRLLALPPVPPGRCRRPKAPPAQCRADRLPRLPPPSRFHLRFRTYRALADVPPPPGPRLTATTARAPAPAPLCRAGRKQSERLAADQLSAWRLGEVIRRSRVSPSG